MFFDHLLPSAQPPIPHNTFYTETSLPYTVKNVYTHNKQLFTQGLSYHTPYLYESTGLYGQSSLRKYAYPNILLSKHTLQNTLFGEGVVKIGHTVYQLTWKNHKIFKYHNSNESSLFLHEGWGLTSISYNLVYSDGTANVYFQSIDQNTPWKHLIVHDRFGPVPSINDICFHQGLILANIWFSDKVAIIQPISGRIIGEIDFSPLRSVTPYINKSDVLNGITSIDHNTIMITGKNWPFFYEITLDLTQMYMHYHIDYSLNV